MTPHDRPTPAELVEAVREFLEGELLPGVADPRLRFRTLVALNGLGIAQRELGTVPQGPAEDELADLLDRIRAGDPAPDTLPRLQEHVAAKLRVASPRYLQRYR